MATNKMMRLATCLLIAVLLTGSVVSGTFAKYVTSATSSDSARVAKWGVTIIANGDGFSKKYVNKVNGDIGTAGNANLTVESTEKVVAPGTKGDFVAMTLEGTPEVAIRVDYDATLTLKGWEIEGNVYCPM